jgi:hypothetical protein
MTDEPAAQAHALLERLVALLHDCHALGLQLDASRTDLGPVSALAERLPYYAVLIAIEAGLGRMAEDALTALRQASRPRGPMGEEWLRRQERGLEGER